METESGGLAPMRGSDNMGLPLDTTLFDAANLVGLAITILAAVVSNCGVQLQKLAHAREKPNSTSYFAQKQWMFGLMLVVIGSIGDFEALSFATQSLVATVGGGTTVVTNVLFSTYWHGESLTFRDAYGTSCILLGVLLIAISSPEDEQYNIDQLVHRFESPVVVTYILSLGVLMVYLHVLIDAEKQTPPSVHALCHFAFLTMHLQGASLSVAPTKGMALRHNRFRRFLRCHDDATANLEPTLYATVRCSDRTYPANTLQVSGIMGSLSMLLGKCASEMVKTSLEGASQFTHPTTYLFFGGMVGTILLQIHWFNEALMRGDIAVVFPIFQVFWIAFGVVGGMVFYGDLARLEFFQGVSFLLAFACILVGVYYLAQHEPYKPLVPAALLHDGARHDEGDTSFYLEQASQVLLDPATPQASGREGDSEEMLNDIRRPYRPPALLRTV
ncbi:hypothetical protein ACHHYP_04877 [Achlya hypogyna]|uniref:Uncharacterized protein n=1 Tax=Achlya hypogyna TaxID=1202772 RepID=A0A1V9ZP04_ACHHY|nr:hypothetical protein ACHHYP_04877 [Achlya hypogyna]